eukprot:SAG31_NODE_2672_length_5268_cov_41.402273_3_plen_59_part_00
MLSQTAALQSTDWAAVSSCDMRRALRLQLMAACAVMAVRQRHVCAEKSILDGSFLKSL